MSRLSAAPTSAQFIGIFFDQGGTSCVAEVGEHPIIDLQIIAVLENDLPEMTGAQFQNTGAPSSWNPSNALWVPDEGLTINMGHPLFPNAVHPEVPGVNIAFSSCQTGQVPLGGDQIGVSIILLRPASDSPGKRNSFTQVC